MLNDEFLLEDSWRSAKIEDETLDYHNKLMVKFSEQLGYRVIKAKKSNVSELNSANFK